MTSMDRQEAARLLADGLSPRWAEVGWIIPPKHERRPSQKLPRLAHRIIASRRTGAWTLRCNSRIAFTGYRLVQSILGWPEWRTCQRCGRIELSPREQRREFRPLREMRRRNLERRRHMLDLARRRRRKQAVRAAWLANEEEHDE